MNKSQKTPEEYRSFSHQILHKANIETPRIDFLHNIAKMLKDFSECDGIELWLKENNISSRFEVICYTQTSFQFEILAIEDMQPSLHQVKKNVLEGRIDDSLPFFTKNGSFWIGDIHDLLHLDNQIDISNENYLSQAVIPLVVVEKIIGILQLKSKQRGFFIVKEIEYYEGVAQTLSIALMNQRAQAALQERIKELTCLYNFAQIAEQPNLSLNEILHSIVKLLPPAWQYPNITAGKIILDGRVYTTSNYSDDKQKQTADIIVNGKNRGSVEVVYTEDKPTIDEGPFLKEERSLINAIAREVAHIVERRQAEEDKVKLQEQLRHADRLATIGQLAAGVAHELNEPLGNILGFAQLIQKCERLPSQANQDLDKIVSASLYAREVIKKLMLFSRQTPPSKTKVDLNKIIEEGLYFLDARCTKAGIKLIRSLSPELPKITADPAQLNQVLVNLVVNAIQAMPEGGTLTVQTLSHDDSVSLIVEDTGVGISEEILPQIFIPFFTTKDVDQGTGLGLAVVHGIVTSHKGSINVDSKPDKGTKFKIKIPI